MGILDQPLKEILAKHWWKVAGTTGALAVLYLSTIFETKEKHAKDIKEIENRIAKIEEEYLKEKYFLSRNETVDGTLEEIKGGVSSTNKSIGELGKAFNDFLREMALSNDGE